MKNMYYNKCKTEGLDHSSESKNVFRGKVKMFCLNQKTNIYIAENASAIFLCPDFTPETAPFEEQMSIPHVVTECLPGDTPADVTCSDNAAEYRFLSDSCENNLSVTSAEITADDMVACESQNVVSEDVISIENDLSEEISPMFQFRKHIPNSFYITVCNGDYLLFSSVVKSVEISKYYRSDRGADLCGMELKIRVQSFKL